jgi:hypothetical protein
MRNKSKAMRRAGFAALAVFVVTASVAGAQLIDGNHDGSPAGGPVGAVYTVGCGPTERSIVRTQSNPGATSSVAWTNLPAAQIPISVPAGTTKCIKVVFTAETSCTRYQGPDFCYVRALDNGVPMDPDGANFQAIDSESATARAHAYEWVKRLPAGYHLIEIEQRVGNPATVFTTDDWTMDVSING